MKLKNKNKKTQDPAGEEEVSEVEPQPDPMGHCSMDWTTEVVCPEVKDWAINVPISGSHYCLQ